MPDIFHDFPIKSALDPVFRAVSEPRLGGMYLRILKRYLEHGETVPYERRLEV
jgi:hypothetical protein